MITALLDGLAALPVPLLVLAAGALVLGETTLGLGFVVPGETGLLVAAAAVSGVGEAAALAVVVAVCAGIGDSLSYLIGRRYGPRLRDTAVVRRTGVHHFDRATALLRRHGAWAVLGARFLPVVRTLTPAAAGAAGLPYRRFLPASAVGAAAWSLVHVGVGAGAGSAARHVEAVLGGAGWLVLVAVAATAAVVVLHRRRRPLPATDHPPRAEGPR